MIKSPSSLRRVLLLLTCLLTATACGAFTPAQAKVVLSTLFVDGGIIQRDKPVNVFGTAKPGEIVTCEMAGNKGVCIVKKSGNFLVTLPAPQGEGPFTLRVVGDNLIEVKNLTPGEVWIIAGDEGVEKDSLQAGAPIESSDLPPTLQLFKVPIRLSDKPVRLVDGRWQKATESGAMSFSALGLRFGCDLAKQVGGPIGIIQLSCPESPIKSWISAGGLLSKQETAGAAGKSTLTKADFDKLSDEYRTSLESWQASLTAGKEPPPKPLPNVLMRSAASSLFNGMVAPLTPYSVRGVVLDHGASDIAEVLNYKNFLAVFMKDLRQVFRQDGLPVIMLQSGAIGEAQKGDDSPISVLRHVQFKARVWPRTYMAVGVDMDRRDPKTGAISTDFDTLAQRITNIALTTQYRTPAPMTYPIIETVEPIADGEALKLQLRYADKGLVYKGTSADTDKNKDKSKDRDKTTIKGFSVSSWNHQYFDADAELQNDKIIVRSKFVKEPKFVRYGWGNSPALGLYSQDGLPLVPYISDR
jgi:sialate O-acetylesterase